MGTFSKKLESEDARNAKLDADNVFETGTVILKSPNGSLYKIVVANDGTLSATATTVDSAGRPVTSGNPYA